VSRQLFVIFLPPRDELESHIYRDSDIFRPGGLCFAEHNVLLKLTDEKSGVGLARDTDEIVLFFVLIFLR
jgi:hypothetical protein